MALEVLICPFLIPLFMLIAWSKATGKGVVLGKYTFEECLIETMLAHK